MRTRCASTREDSTHLDFVISVRLVANELLRSLLDDFGLECWSHCHDKLWREKKIELVLRIDLLFGIT